MTPLRSARLAIALLLAINLFNYIDRYVLAAVESKIARELLPGDPNALAKMGSLATAFILSYMISAPIFGWLADRMSRWLLVGLGVLVWTLASGGSGVALTFTMLLTTRLFVGVGEGGYGPAAPTIIADLFPIERRGSVMAWFYMAIPLGSALGYMLGGQIEALAGWRWAFYIVVPPGLLLGILCFFMRDPARGNRVLGLGARVSGQAADLLQSPETRSPKPEIPVLGLGARASGQDADSLHSAETQDPEPQTQPPARFRDYLSLAKNPSYLLDCAGMCAMTFAIGGISFWMPRYISEVRHAGTLEHVNFIFGALTAVSGIIATLAGGWAGDKLKPFFSGSYFLVSGIGILIACPAVIAMLYWPFPLAWVAVFIAEFFLFFNTGPSNTILANVTHPTIRATAFALNILLIHALGDALSPPVLGHLAERFSWNIAFATVIAAMACAGVLWLIGINFLARDEARIETGAHGFEVQLLK